MYDGSSHCVVLTGIKSNEFRRQKWPREQRPEGCEFKSGKLLDIFSNTKLLATVSF